LRATDVQGSEVSDMNVDAEVNYELAGHLDLRMRRTGQPLTLKLPQQ
jgi:hypothetical protein